MNDKPSRQKSLFSNSKYFGKHVLVAGKQVYAVKSDKEASRIFDQLVKKGVIPTVTFIPKNQSLVLVWK